MISLFATLSFAVLEVKDYSHLSSFLDRDRAISNIAKQNRPLALLMIAIIDREHREDCLNLALQQLDRKSILNLCRASRERDAFWRKCVTTLSKYRSHPSTIHYLEWMIITAGSRNRAVIYHAARDQFSVILLGYATIDYYLNGDLVVHAVNKFCMREAAVHYIRSVCW